jgi:hypothetical protein
MRSRRVLIALAAVVLAATACSSSPAVTTSTASSSGPLAGVCKPLIKFALSWFPESTQGPQFQLLGGNVTVDTNHKSVTGDLYDQGKPTGVRIELMAGGPAVSGIQASELMKVHPDIDLGQEAMDDVIASWTQDNPTVAVMAPLQVDPVVYIWDAKVHPDWNTITDIGQTNDTVFTFPTAQVDYLVGSGILRAKQLNTSYDGSPTHLMEKRSAAVGGFSTNEVYIYNQLHVQTRYAYVADAGFPNYRNAVIVRKSDVTEKAACLHKLVPILQRASVAFFNNPDPALKRIVDLDAKYPAPYSYSLEQARYGVRVMWEDGLAANGADRVFGSLDVAPSGRLDKVLGDLRPVYASRRVTVPAGLTGASLATNQFLDHSVVLGQEPHQ